MPAADLRKYAYSDGTTFYLARGPAEQAAKPVKIWGYFSDGRLQHYVLLRDGQRTVHMNTGRFVKLVRSKFAR